MQDQDNRHDPEENKVESCSENPHIFQEEQIKNLINLIRDNGDTKLADYIQSDKSLIHRLKSHEDSEHIVQNWVINYAVFYKPPKESTSMVASYIQSKDLCSEGYGLRYETTLHGSSKLIEGIVVPVGEMPSSRIVYVSKNNKFTFYEGPIIDYSKKTGVGMLLRENGMIYHGNFEKDKQNGFGKITMADGRSYEGLWKNNKRHGQGKIVYQSGDYEIGEYAMDQQVGEHKQFSRDHKLISLITYKKGCVVNFVKV
ncbi:hypothetical protein FGO68_gene5871 [Halteria grandinella]|uniref:MORN repeat protein n=1 Tax=Halteria grandinella TaxID=5974 RepID=A0A8J8NU51_HALGN|nr:hypothetical protein FGO68_gene5871 [Halteria grandinella]